MFRLPPNICHYCRLELSIWITSWFMQRQIHTSRFSPPYGILEQQKIICPVRSVASSSICSFWHRKSGWRGRRNRMAHFLLKTFGDCSWGFIMSAWWNIGNVFQLERERKADWFYVWPLVWVYVLFPIRNNILKGCNVDICSSLFLPLKSSPLIIFFNIYFKQ